MILSKQHASFVTMLMLLKITCYVNKVGSIDAIVVDGGVFTFETSICKSACVWCALGGVKYVIRWKLIVFLE